MRRPSQGNLSLTQRDVRMTVVERLKTYLPLRVSGRRLTTDMVLDVVLEAAVTGRTVEAVCDDLADVADANTIRQCINSHFRADQLAGLEDQLNQALVADIPGKVFRGARDIACDLHDQPFYGQTPGLLALACRARARAGTTYFYRVATAYAMHHGVRVTLAVAFVRPTDSLPEVLASLLARVAQLGVRVARLWLDKGFATTPIYRHLLAIGMPAIIACPIRGQRGGTRALCRGRASYTTTHTFHSQAYGDCTVPVVVARTFTSSRRRRRPNRATWLVFVQINSCLKPHQVRQLYRRRFGIESSHRTMRQVRARTTSRNPALRFVYMALGFILVNIWISLRFLYCQIPRRGRGGRPLAEDRLRLNRLAAFVRRWVEQRYDVISEIRATALPIHVDRSVVY